MIDGENVTIPKTEWERLIELRNYKDRGDTDWKAVRQQIDKMNKEVEDDNYIMQPEDELIINPKTGRLQIKRK